MENEDEDVESKSPKFSLQLPTLPKMLTLEEKKYLLAIERGDLPNVRRMLHRAQRKKTFDINCVDSLGRGALTIAIDQENLEMVELLVVMSVETRDALLYSISVEFVEAVELLLEHEELIHKEGDPYSWQKVDINIAIFTPDITPLILAAHRNNYEILKILLDRGATIPMPHDIKCGCEDCISLSEEDSLRHSLSRLNEYKALASPSLIALSSSDPLLTAFQLSWELRNLAFAEPESKSEYMVLRKQCQEFAVDLLQQSRSSQELAIILNHDPDNPPYKEGEHMTLARLELAIMYKQKKFVAHPNIQQLLAALWYEGVPGFRRKSSTRKIMIIVKVALLFPLYCLLYTFAPGTKTGKLMRKPFMKFLIHASSYLFFLLLLILVSLRAEDLLLEYFGSESMRAAVIEKYQKQRGNTPTFLEYIVLIYVIGFIVEETEEIFTEGINSYLKNLWNFIDFTRNLFYALTFVLRVLAYIQQTNEIQKDPSTVYLRREQWHAFDPQLIAEGLFAAANIFSALKLVHLFSINPHLGPLQISLGRMVIDIVKFFFIYSLVLFAFACGLNQLLWYFSDLEKQKCYHLPNGEPDFDHAGESCMKWRRFANVFESSQSLFWASFGLVDLDSFELTGIKTYTRFWGLLMFGSYSVINVIVLLNLLIAMMSNSYAMITEHSDVEWKFARTKLWLSYFEESGTLPPPFNIIPKPKHLFKLLGMRKKDNLKEMSTGSRNREEKERDYRYTAVMRALVWRYVSAMHRKADENQVTEDDINEVKSDISAFRYELLEVLNKNGMDTSSAAKKEKAILGRKMKIWERRLMKDFKVAPVSIEETDDLFAPAPEGETSIARFRRIAKMAALDSTLNKWQQVVKGACIASQIGRCHSKDSFKKQQNLQKAMQEARRLTSKSPDISRSITPLALPDFTGADIINLIKNDTTPDDESKGRFSISPNVTIMSQESIGSTTISIIPPQSPIHKPQDQLIKVERDLINLNSTQPSPLSSIKKLEDTSKPASSGCHDQFDRNEKRVLFDIPNLITAAGEAAVATAHFFTLTSPSGVTLTTLPTKAKYRTTYLSNSTKYDHEELETLKELPAYRSPEVTQSENQQNPITIPSSIIPEPERSSPTRKHREENEYRGIDALEKEEFSSGDSESCDELNRIISPERTLGSSKSPANHRVIGWNIEDIVKTDKDGSDNEDRDVIPHYASNNIIPEILVERDAELITGDLEIEDIGPQTPRPPTPQPLSPPPESPSRPVTPMSQKNIQRVYDNRRPQPKYGWL